MLRTSFLKIKCQLTIIIIFQLVDKLIYDPKKFVYIGRRGPKKKKKYEQWACSPLFIFFFFFLHVWHACFSMVKYIYVNNVGFNFYRFENDKQYKLYSSPTVHFLGNWKSNLPSTQMFGSLHTCHRPYKGINNTLINNFGICDFIRWVWLVSLLLFFVRVH